jgi:pimeloyl-ACP methyl ester carboxylesterase
MRWLGTLFDGAASRLDQAAVAALGWRGAGDTAEVDALAHEERLERLARVRELYHRAEGFFTEPCPIEVKEKLVRPLPDGRIADWSWRSGCEPFLDEVREVWLAHEKNHVAHARAWLGNQPRPAVIVIHGYGSGHWRMEERLWPIQMLRERGLDVVLPILPLHGPRARAQKPWPPPFPAADPRLTHEGFRQAMHDLRGLVRFLRARGHARVGVMGMSLGGYTASLLSTLEADLAFLAPVIPLASLADFALQAGRLGKGEAAIAQHAALEAAYAQVSPFSRRSLVPPDRVVIVGAMADRITGMDHARRLHGHLGGQLVECRGGHLLQYGLEQGYRAVGELIDRIAELRPDAPVSGGPGGRELFAP